MCHVRPFKYKQGWTGNENEVDAGGQFTGYMKSRMAMQSDTVNKDRQHEKYRHN